MRNLVGLILMLAVSTTHAHEPDVRPMGQSDSYAYSASALRATLDDPAVDAFQLHLAWGEDDTLHGSLTAVDADGQPLYGVPGTFVGRAIDTARLAAMDDITADVMRAQPPALAAHILQPRIASAFITSWAALRKSGAPLAPALSHADEPIVYHTIDKAMIVDIVTRAETAELVVVWGLNSDGKIAPVLMGFDHDEAEMVGSVAEIGFALDFVTPCPPTCRFTD